jgi:ERF superfamily protein
MRTSEQINEIAAAMATAQGNIKPAMKDATNPAFRSKYADLSAIWEAIRGPLAANKIAVWQEAELTEAGVAVTTRLAHASGQWVEFGPLTVPCSKRDAHGVGSATTYAKRYAIAAVVGVVSDDDDDGNAAVQKPAPGVEIVAPKPTTQTVIPAGAVLLKKTEQKATPTGKPYWLLVLSTGEEVIEWKEQQAIFAEQACQNGEPVIITTSGGQWDGKPVVRTILRADQLAPKKTAVKKELAAADIAF